MATGVWGGFAFLFKFVSIMEVIAPIPKYNLNEAEEKRNPPAHRGLLKELKPKLKPVIRNCFALPLKWLWMRKTMRRKSGEPYILHPLAVAKICVEEIGLVSQHYLCSVARYSGGYGYFAEYVQREFGAEIAKL